MMFERPYLTPMADIIIDYFEEKVPALKATIDEFLKPTEDEEGKKDKKKGKKKEPETQKEQAKEENKEEGEQKEKKKEKKNELDAWDSNQSAIYYSSEESYLS